MTTRYNPHLLPDLKKLYHLKETLIEKYQYHQANDYIRIELKNVLKSDICQMIYFQTGSRDEIIRKIGQELKDPIYERIMQIEKHPHVLQEPFVKAIASKDANALYEFCQKQVRKERPIKIVKRIASFILTHL